MQKYNISLHKGTVTLSTSILLSPLYDLNFICMWAENSTTISSKAESDYITNRKGHLQSIRLAERIIVAAKTAVECH